MINLFWGAAGTSSNLDRRWYWRDTDPEEHFRRGDERLVKNVPMWHHCPGVRLVTRVNQRPCSAPLKAVLWHRRIAPRGLTCGYRNYRARMQ